MDDIISRQAAIDDLKIFTKDCNPEHFVGHSNFIEYMDTVGIRSFGNWQYANGFNMGLTAAEVAIEKVPSARRKGKWKVYNILDYAQRPTGRKVGECSFCEHLTGEFRTLLESHHELTNFCPNCGAEMTKGEEDERIKNS